MPLISRLGVLIAYDPATEADMIRMERRELVASGQEIQEAIAEIIQQKNEDFHRQVERRLQSIDTTFQRMIPDIPKEKKEEIKFIAQDAVQKGVSRAPFADVNFSDF